MKALFAKAELPQASYRVLRRRDEKAEREALEALGLPVFVKPANLGSSVAVSKVKRAADLPRALDRALAYDGKAMIEAAIDGREIEVSVLGNDDAEASVPGEIVPDREFYDYDSKYSAGSRTELRIPAPLDDRTTALVRELAVRAFRAVDACGYARVDFFIERGSGRPLVNEINTIPGFTSISMFPKLWEATGLPYPALLDRLLELALARRRERARLKTTYEP
jgi:D-alanine-D-alanine ligase